MNKRITIFILVLASFLLLFFVYKNFYSLSPAERDIQEEIKYENKVAKSKVLENITHLREVIESKELGTGEDLSIFELGVAQDKRAIPVLSEIIIEYITPVTPPEHRYEWSMDGSDEVRIDAANALREIGDIKALPALKQAILEDKNPKVREAALIAYEDINKNNKKTRSEIVNILKTVSKSEEQEISTWAKERIKEYEK